MCELLYLIRLCIGLDVLMACYIVESTGICTSMLILTGYVLNWNIVDSFDHILI